MATVIVRAYCGSGFVVAADGRRIELDRAGGVRTVAEDMQKIYRVGDSLAYCAKGIPQLGDNREDRLETILFDFFPQFAEYLVPEVADRHSSVSEFARSVADAVNDKLRVACADPNIDVPRRYPRKAGGHEIIKLFIDGYLHGRPARAEVLFWHDGGRVGRPDVESGYLRVGLTRHGSQVVADKLSSDRLFRAKYEIENAFLGSEYAEDLARLICEAAVFVEASKSLDVAALDPDCRAVGGRTHIAVIPKNGNFQWVIPPASSSTAL